MPDVDVAILGGGCAGLSLGARLAGRGVSFRIVEPRQAYDNDRTWSFWRTGPHPWEKSVRRSWTRWSVAGPGGAILRGSHAIPYQTLEGRAFYDAAQARIAAAPGGHLSLGVTAGHVRQEAPGALVETSDGGFRAAIVVDTRPPRRRPSMGQFFAGREIVTDHAVFDPATVQLMHFRRGHSDGVDFLYVLPFAVDRALVEVTSFARTAPSRAAMQAWLDAEIDALEPGGHDVVRTEAGALPMEVGFRAAAQPGTVHMGLAGGAARPATGYAFQRIQAQADTLAAHLIAGRPPVLPRDGAALAWMDAIFLKVLATWPARGPALFEALFGRVGPDRLERFLSGSTRADDRLAVITALPPRPFLAAATGLA